MVIRDPEIQAIHDRHSDLPQDPLPGVDVGLCRCPVNEHGDIRCHVCGEYVNKRCWNCGTSRGDGPCPNRETGLPPTGPED